MTKKRPPPSLSSSSMKTSRNCNNNNNINNGGDVDISSVGVSVSVGKIKSNSKRSSLFSLAKYCDDRTSIDDADNVIDDDDMTSRVYHGICPDVSNRYRKVGDGHRIGQGTYGVVYRARDTWVKDNNGNENNDNNANGNGNNANGNRNGNGNIHSSASQDNKTKNPQQTNNNTNNNNNSNNNIVALKKCYAHHESSDGFSITTLREINALRVCSTHPNIVNLLEIAVSSSSNSNSNSNNGNDNGGNSNENENENKDKDKNRHGRRPFPPLQAAFTVLLQSP